jgi:hypothetical protein
LVAGKELLGDGGGELFGVLFGIDTQPDTGERSHLQAGKEKASQSVN